MLGRIWRILWRCRRRCEFCLLGPRAMVGVKNSRRREYPEPMYVSRLWYLSLRRAKVEGKLLAIIVDAGLGEDGIEDVCRVG